MTVSILNTLEFNHIIDQKDRKKEDEIVDTLMTFEE